MTFTANDIMFVRQLTGLSIPESKAAVLLIKQDGEDVYDEEVQKKLLGHHYVEKVRRYAKWLELQSLIAEFGPLEYSKDKNDNCDTSK